MLTDGVGAETSRRQTRRVGWLVIFDISDASKIEEVEWALRDQVKQGFVYREKTEEIILFRFHVYTWERKGVYE